MEETNTISASWSTLAKNCGGGVVDTIQTTNILASTQEEILDTLKI